MEIPENIVFLTIEKIQNGFVINIPEGFGDNDVKIFKGSINGVVKVLEHCWDSKFILPEKRGESTVEEILASNGESSE